MSEGVAQNIGDEQAVVGEPASHPHQAVVVGEPPEDMAPVLGEPVPLANGLRDRQPISPPSAEETSVNGVQMSSHLHSALEPTYSSNPSSVAPDETTLVLQELPAAEESSISESDIGEAAVEVGAHRSDIPVAENPHPSESHVQEISSASDVPAIEATDAADVSAESHDANRSVEEEPATDIPNVVEVTHIADTPSEVLPPVPTENPFLALDEGSTADDEKKSGEDPLVLDQSLPATLVSVEAPDANVSPAQDETLSKGLGASDAAQQGETSIPLSHLQEGLPTQDPTSIQTPLEDMPSGGAEVSEDVKEELHSVEPELADAPPQDSDAVTQQGETTIPLSHLQERLPTKDPTSTQTPLEDTPSEGAEVSEHVKEELHSPQDSDAVKAIPAETESGCTEVEHSLATQPDHASETDASVQENDTKGEIPAGSETASSGVEQVLSRETPLSEFLIKESPTPRDDVLQEVHAASDASQVLNDPKTPAETRQDSPVASEDIWTMFSDECLADQTSKEEASIPPAANGDSGFQHHEDRNLEREEDLSKGEDESAEVKEKPSSRMKLPYIVTGLAIAAVSIAFVSISRPH